MNALNGHWMHLLFLGSLLAGAVVTWRIHARLKKQILACQRECRMREELEAYAQVDTSLPKTQAGALDRVEPRKALAKRLCKTVSEKSVFTRVGLMMRDAEGRLYCAGSVGVDDLTVKALDAWGRRVVEEERSGLNAGEAPDQVAPAGPPAVREGVQSFSIALGEWARFDPEVAEWAQAGHRERRRWRRALVAPVRISTGKITGALVVCADGPRERVRKQFQEGVERAMGPIEALAARLAGSMEHDMISERLQRAEKLAGLGQLAQGLAQALQAPLTSVLGFAELITETAGEARIRQDAETIRAEATKMRETVEKLAEFWRPAAPVAHDVNVVQMMRETAAVWSEKLRTQRVELCMQTGSVTPSVRGNGERMRQMLEHLVSNAAQSIAVAEACAARGGEGSVTPEEGHSIRLTVTEDARAVQIIVSDTGTGFAEPERIFDPFYTTRGPQAGGGPEAGAGMGLSLCYGIAREHGGEISAVNLYPRGAAVVVEFPVIGEVQVRPTVPREVAVPRLQPAEPAVQREIHAVRPRIPSFAVPGGSGGPSLQPM